MPLSKQAWLALSFHFLLAPPHDLFADGSLFSPLFRDSSNLSSPSPGGGLGSWLTALRLITPSPFFAVFDFGLQLASTSASTSSFSWLWCDELSERSSWDLGSLSGEGAGRLRESLRRGKWGESSQLVVTWCQQVRWWEREHCIRLQDSIEEPRQRRRRLASEESVNCVARFSLLFLQVAEPLSLRWKGGREGAKDATIPSRGFGRYAWHLLCSQQQR